MIAKSTGNGSDNACVGTARDQRPYVLSNSESEFKRLEQQSEFYRDLTEDVLWRAGLARGMRVLDIGSGAGDVSLLAARIVGPTGAVLGIDRSAEAVATARRRAADVRHESVSFAVTDIDAFETEEKFDAVIGRLILMYLPDSTATLRRLCSHLRPGGIVAFQEMAMHLMQSTPAGPQFARCRDWVLRTFERIGFETDMGSKLFATYRAAGLPPPHMIAAARVEGGTQSPAYDYMANTLRSMLPAMQTVGVVTADEVEVDTLAERLRREAVENDACIMLPPLIGAWTHTPA